MQSAYFQLYLEFDFCAKCPVFPERVTYIYVTRSEKTYHFAQKLKKRYKQKSRKKSFFNPNIFLAYLKFQLLGYLLAKFQHVKCYSFAKRAAQRELLLFSSRGRLYVNGNCETRFVYKHVTILTASDFYHNVNIELQRRFL